MTARKSRAMEVKAAMVGKETWSLGWDSSPMKCEHCSRVDLYKYFSQRHRGLLEIPRSAPVSDIT